MTRRANLRRLPAARHSGRAMARALAIAVFVMGAGGVAKATPEKAARYYEDALKRFDKDELDAAVIQLKNALKEDKGNLAAHLLLAKVLMRNSEYKAAEAAFEEALKQGVNRAEVVIPLARIYLALGRPEMVISRILPAGLSRDVQVSVHTVRGTAYFEMGNARAAAQAFQEARILDPGSAVPLIEEVPTLLGTGQREQARQLASRAIQLAPNNAAAWNMHASVLHEALDVAGALAAYSKALEIDGRHTDARVARAALLIDMKRDADAEKDLATLVKNAPDEPRAAYLRALLGSKKGDAGAVKKSLTEAAHVIDSMPPGWISGREQLGMVAALAHHALGNTQKARDYLEVIVQRNPRHLPARKLLASIHVQRRDYARALPLLEALQKALPDDPQVLYQLGSLYMGQRRYAQATDFLERASARLSTADVVRTLGFSQIGLGRDELGQANLEKVFATNAGDADAGTALAMLYMRRGEAKRALATAEAMVKSNPGNLTAVNFLGTIMGATGDRAGARAAYAQALARDPAFRPAVLNLVKLDVAEGRFDTARQRLSEILSKRDGDVDALYELGLVEQRAGKPDQAARHFRKAMESQRRDTRAGMALIELLTAQGKVDDAVAAAKEMASKFPDAIGVQIALARAYIVMGDHGSAKSVLHGATRFAEFDPDLQVSIGRLQLAAGNAEGAAYSVQKALQGRPDDVQALVLLVDVELRRRSAAGIDAAAKQLATRHPNRVETAQVAGGIALSRNQFPAAIAAYRTALSRQESTGNALNLANALIASGDVTKAAVFLDEWVKKFPKDQVGLRTLAETQFRAGQLPAARLSYTRALAAEPDNAVMLNNFANLLLRLGDAGAQAAAERAVKLAPGNPSFADTLGWILVQKGQTEAGLRYLREARLRSPDNPEIRFHLAFALSKVGRRDEAKTELASALSSPARLENTAEVTSLKRELGL
ncbi:MAG: XrtA/PEP-CTERM system TPR-repeat protein PrsT [Burkholderiales bacterium]